MPATATAADAADVADAHAACGPLRRCPRERRPRVPPDAGDGLTTAIALGAGDGFTDSRPRILHDSSPLFLGEKQLQPLNMDGMLAGVLFWQEGRACAGKVRGFDD